MLSLWWFTACGGCVLRGCLLYGCMIWLHGLLGVGAVWVVLPVYVSGSGWFEVVCGDGWFIRCAYRFFVCAL